jgi:TM2 domain-containing membrane protein YozV
MTQGPEYPNPSGSTPDPNQPPPPPPPPYGEQAPAPQPNYGEPPPQPAYGQQPYAPPGAAADRARPATLGIPYSDKSKIVAALLQILIPLGIGRFYIGDNKTGTWQLVVTILTCGIGALWPFIDGIIMLASDSKDAQGRPLRS